MEPQLCSSEAALIQNSNLLPIVQCYYQLRDWNVAVSLPRTGQCSITSQNRLHQDMKWMPLISTFQACFQTLKEHSHFQLKTQLCLSYLQQYSWFCCPQRSFLSHYLYTQSQNISYPLKHLHISVHIFQEHSIYVMHNSKSTLFMLSELHKTFIHPEFIVFIASKFLCVIYV